MTHLRAVLFIAIVAAVVATGYNPSLPHKRSGAEPSGVIRNRSANAPRTTSLDGDSPETEWAMATATPDRSHISGLAGYAVPSLGPSYLAMRLPAGTHVLIVGPGGSWQAIVNDYGPSSLIRPSRIADIAAGHWEHVCGLPLSAGLCHVSVSVTRAGVPVAPRPNPTAPSTDK